MTQDEARALIARLTPEEREALQLIAQGVRSKRGADACRIGERGMQHRRARIVAKLGCNLYRACWVLGRAAE